MTPSRIADLQYRWKLRTNPPKCTHLAVELDTNETGDVTDDSHCIVCGELVVKKVI